MRCDRAPEGWSCRRDAGHDGPCAATTIARCERTMTLNVPGIGLRTPRCGEPAGHGGTCVWIDVHPLQQCRAGLPGWIDERAEQAACQLERGHAGPHRIEWGDE